jgi:hypothetical protein
MGWTFYNASGQQLKSTALPAAATQAEMEAGSLNTVFVTPGRTHFHDGVAKAWCKWEATGTHSILGSYGWTSITDGGAAGDTDHTLAVTFSSINEQVFAGVTDDARFVSVGTSAAGTVTTKVYIHDGTASDVDRNMLVAFGDLA